jgi:hypothetical protein
MKHIIKKAIALLLLLCIYTSAGFALTKSTGKSQNSDFVWIVFNFNFSCADDGRVKPEARVILKWGGKEGRAKFSCYGRPDRNLKGFVIRLSKRNKPPLSQLTVFSAENCTASGIYQIEPPEENDPRYKIDHHVTLY